MKPVWRLSVFVAAVIAVLLVLLRVLDRAPATLVAATDQSRFSAQRAHAHLEDLLKENVPHPAGSTANKRIEDRIVAKLRAWGYEPQVQAGLKCSPLAPGCSVVRNIIAIRKGRDSRHAVMVTAHYDSVPGSAAAADDGAGVAVMLEIAERISVHEPFLHDVVFLFADAEETGLRGAMHFADAHPLMKRVAFVLNMEARGASGPSLMFETGADNAAVIAAFADAVPQPVSNSLLFEAYRRMPNNTDFTIYKQEGVAGLNFAFSRAASLYHSERDDLAHLDKASLQHQGDNVSTALLLIAQTPPGDLVATGDAIWFDVGGLLPRWSGNWNVFLAAFGLMAVGAVGFRQARTGWRGLAWSMCAVLVLIVLVPAMGGLLSWPLGIWPQAHPLDHPHPWPGRIALIAASIAAVFMVAAWFAKRAEPAAMATIAWLFFAVISLACALTVPGTTYVCLVPLLLYVAGAGIASVRSRAGGDPLRIAAAIGFAAAAYMALYHFILLEVLFGFAASYAKVVPLLLMALPLLPLAVTCARTEGVRIPLSLAAVVALIAALAGWMAPTSTFDRPRGVNLLYVQDDAAGEARWQIESLGDPGRDVLDAMGFDAAPQSTLRYGVVPIETHLKAAPLLALESPEVAIDEDFERDGQRVLRGSLRSRRDTWQVGIGFPAQSPVIAMSVEGQPVLESASDDPRVVRLHGIGEAAVRFEIAAQPRQPLSIVALDIGPLGDAGNTGEAAQMLSRRPDFAAPLHAGNQSIVLTRLNL